MIIKICGIKTLKLPRLQLKLEPICWVSISTRPARVISQPEKCAEILSASSQVTHPLLRVGVFVNQNPTANPRNHGNLSARSGPVSR